MFILFSISNALKFWSVNHASIDETPGSKVSKHNKIFEWNI